MSHQDSNPKVSVDKVNLDVACSHAEENGFLDLTPALDSEKAIYEYLHQPPMRTSDDHLVEFSEALRTVAKALRRVAEGKAAAQAEAAEWKRKYELERAHNLQLRNKALAPSLEGCHDLSKDLKLDNSSSKLMVHNPTMEQSEKCCGMRGICSHEILRDEDTDASSKLAGRRAARKASFRLAWGCNGDKSGQHKHEIVSFEKGNITTAERSSKQILLKWESQPQTVLILTKPNSTSVRLLCAEMVR